MNVPELSVVSLHSKLKFCEEIDYPQTFLATKLSAWKMEVNDQPIFRYLYRNFRPLRHLEFGTWQGGGLTYCLEESNAIAWTINLPFGEFIQEKACYGLDPDEVKDAKAWARKVGLNEKDCYQTDRMGFIGRHYLNKNLGNRVCQIYCNSTDWVIDNYPIDFFDSVLIDGSHKTEDVVSDTLKSLKLTRKGAMIMWHDYCPPVYNDFECVKGVMDAVTHLRSLLDEELEQLFWIKPSWILLGIKKST